MIGSAQRWVLSVMTTNIRSNSRVRLSKHSSKRSLNVHDSTIVCTWRPISILQRIGARRSIWVSSIRFHKHLLTITSAAMLACKVSYEIQPEVQPYLARTCKKRIIWSHRLLGQQLSIKAIRILTRALSAPTWRHYPSDSIFPTSIVLSIIKSTHKNAPTLYHLKSRSNSSRTVLISWF